MNHWCKFLIKLVVVSTVMVILTPTNVFPYICANGSGGSFGDDESISHGTSGRSNLIEAHVIEGAGHFLNAYANILVFLNRVEMADMQGMDFDEAASILDRAIESMDSALTVYNQIIGIADRTPYNKNAISKLIDFDYKGFMARRGLNPVIFRDVELYLSNGDVRGVFKHIYRKFALIKDGLIVIKDNIAVEKIFKIPEIWKLNEISSNTLLFGQYTSMCFEKTKIN